MVWVDRDAEAQKKRFYAIASKAEWTDRYAKARFEAEPWYMVDKRIREGRCADEGRVRN